MKPLILDLDPYLDVEELERCHYEICLGVARSKSHMSSRVIPHFEMQNDMRGLIQFKGQEGARIRNVADDGSEFLTPEEKKDFNQLTFEQKRRFLQLYKKAYWDGEFICLRFTKANHHQEKYATFYGDKCEWDENINFFPRTRKFIEALPFTDIGRILIFISYHYLHSDVHYDRRDDTFDGRHHFIWFNPFGRKKFFLLNQDGEKEFVRSRSAYFDTSFLHGAEPAEQMTYTLRVDGQLSREFCEKVGLPWKSRL